MTTDTTQPTGSSHHDAGPDDVVAILQYPVPLWVKNLGTANGTIFGNSNDSANPRDWRENLPAGKWHIGQRDGGFVRLHLELIGFIDRHGPGDSTAIDEKPDECVALASVIGATRALGWLEGYMTEGNRYTVRIRQGHVLIGRGPDLVRSTERRLRPSAALAWLCSPPDMPERTTGRDAAKVCVSPDYGKDDEYLAPGEYAFAHGYIAGPAESRGAALKALAADLWTEGNILPGDDVDASFFTWTDDRDEDHQEIGAELDADGLPIERDASGRVWHR